MRIINYRELINLLYDLENKKHSFCYQKVGKFFYSFKIFSIYYLFEPQIP